MKNSFLLLIFNLLSFPVDKLKKTILQNNTPHFATKFAAIVHLHFLVISCCESAYSFAHIGCETVMKTEQCCISCYLHK